MSDKKRIRKLLLFGFIVSFIFTVGLMIINYELFLEKLYIEKLKEKITNEEIIFDHTLGTKVKLNSDDIDSPWYSYVFFLGIYSSYWFYFGKYFRKKTLDKEWRLCLWIPTIISILFTSMLLYLPLYLVSCYAGKTGLITFEAKDN